MFRSTFLLPFLLLFAAAINLVGGCGGFVQRSGQTSFGVMPGVVNDPANRSLRRGIMRFGLDEFCKELTHRGAPLRLRDDEPVAGRFFARSCNYQELESGDVFVQFAGVGYTWTNVTLRMGFEASGAIQYNQDFLMDGSTMYAYFQTRMIASKTFEVKMVEQGGVVGPTIATLADKVAKDVVETQLQRGFTVIRDPDGTVDFAVGLVDKGKRPVKPFEVHGNDRVTMMNERTNVPGNQLDFLGPFSVDSNNRALYLTLTIDGVPAVDVMVVDKSTGDQWLEQFVRSPGVSQPPMSPLMMDMVPIRAQWQKTVPVAKGHYYVVMDNSATVGNVAPPAVGGMVPPGALVNVVVQVGDAP